MNYIVDKKLEFLKHEMTILNDKIGQLNNQIWKLAQIEITLWLAAIGVGLGAVTQSGRPNTELLAISVIIPILFYIIGNWLLKVHYRFIFREEEIQKFLTQDEYILPATKSKMSFTDFLKKGTISFPIFDLNGYKTFGDDYHFKYNTSYWKGFRHIVPFLFYLFQIIISITLASMEFNRKGTIKFWWLPPLIALIALLSFHILIKKKKKHSIQDQKKKSGEKKSD